MDCKRHCEVCYLSERAEPGVPKHSLAPITSHAFDHRLVDTEAQCIGTISHRAVAHEERNASDAPNICLPFLVLASWSDLGFFFS
jgi:hypothetical protein